MNTLHDLHNIEHGGIPYIKVKLKIYFKNLKSRMQHLVDTTSIWLLVCSVRLGLVKK